VANFRFFFRLHNASCHCDGTSQEPFIYNAEDIISDSVEPIRAIRQVQRPDEVNERVRGDRQFFREMRLEEVSVVSLVESSEQAYKLKVKLRAAVPRCVDDIAQLSVGRDAPVLAHADEDKAVNEPLGGLGKSGCPVLGVCLGEGKPVRAIELSGQS